MWALGLLSAWREYHLDNSSGRGTRYRGALCPFLPECMGVRKREESRALGNKSGQASQSR